jgi:deoxyribonuclease V
MKSLHLHDWELTPRQAITVQERLRDKIVTSDDFKEVHHVAGVDVGFEDGGKVTRAAVAVLAYPELTLIEHAIARLPTRFPYVPGLLSFREVPALLEAFKELKREPDMILCDGHGRAHPRRFGIACHLGLILDLPAIGVAKSRLIGRYGAVPGRRGAWAPLRQDGQIIGAVLRTRAGVKPVYVSAGHRVSLETAIGYVMGCTTRYRLPETTRWAHRLASAK